MNDPTLDPIAHIEHLATKILQALDGQRADIGVMACVQAAVQIVRQEATASGTAADTVTSIRKLIDTLEQIKKAEIAVSGARRQ